MMKIANTPNVGNTENRLNSDFDLKNPDSFPADAANAFAPPINSGEKSENTPAAAISLENIRAELASLTGTQAHALAWGRR
jgi:hypothetical protein